MRWRLPFIFRAARELALPTYPFSRTYSARREMHSIDDSTGSEEMETPTKINQTL